MTHSPAGSQVHYLFSHIHTLLEIKNDTHIQPILPFLLLDLFFKVWPSFSSFRFRLCPNLPFITLNARQIGLCDIYLNERLIYEIPFTTYSHTQTILQYRNRTAPLEFKTPSEASYSIEKPPASFPVYFSPWKI